MSPLSSTLSTYCGRFCVAWPQTCWPPFSRVVGERETLVRAGRREADNVLVGADTTWYLGAELEQHAWSVGVGIAYLERNVQNKILNVAEPVRGIGDEGGALRRRGGLGGARQHGGCSHPRRSERCSCQKAASTNVDHRVALFHAFLPRRVESGEVVQRVCHGRVSSVQRALRARFLQ